MVAIALGALRALPYLALLYVALAAYDSAIDDPRVAAEARQGYVTEAALRAAEARAAEAERQRAAAQKAAAAFEEALRHVREHEDERAAKLEQEIDEYEAKLREDGRTCGLSDSDIEWLRQ